MIIVLKQQATKQQIAAVREMTEQMRYRPRVIVGVEHTVIACVGDETSNLSLEVLRNDPAVESVIPIQYRYKLVSREYHAQDSVVSVAGVKIGGGAPQIIAGPCAMESKEQFESVVRDLTAVGIRLIRAMPYKPRTSPYDFQGLREEGLEIMRAVKREYNVGFISEVMGASQVEPLAAVADMLQIGARNAQNYDLLEVVARAQKPVLLKRGMASTVEEWLSAAEYLVVNGCTEVVLCERGSRSFDPAMRNALDIGAVVVAKQQSHLPVVVDPSHAAGRRDRVLPLARAALAAGADALLVEAHPEPMRALSDAAQQLESGRFNEFLAQIKPWMELATALKEAKQ